MKKCVDRVMSIFTRLPSSVGRTYAKHLIGAFVGLSVSASFAAVTTVDHLIDTDNVSATGCSITTANGAITGIDVVVRNSVRTDASGYRSESVAIASCAGAALGGFQTISTGSVPIAAGQGTSGSSAVETSIPATLIPARDGQMRIAVVTTGSDGLSGGDALTANNGNPILLAAPPVLFVPTLGALALALLAGLIVAAVGLAHRRGYRGMQLVLVGIMATALSGHLMAAIVRDGLVPDWTGIAPLATDPPGDAPAGVDIVAVFGKTDSTEVALRADIVLNAPPTANPQSVTAKVGETLNITLTGSDFENSPLTFTVVTPPTQGTLGGSAANRTYTPNANATASDSFTFRVNDGQLDSAVATVTITNTRAPAITSANATIFTPTQANSFTVLANGMPTPTATFTGCSPSLPASITFTPDANGGGVLAGTPLATDAGAYTCTVTASNGVTPNATQSFTLTVGGTPTITSVASLPNAIEGQAYSHTLTATALLNTAPFQISALAQTGTQPAGLSLGMPSGIGTNSASAPFSGTPASCSRGAYSFNFTATNSFGTTTQAATLNVLARNTAPSFTAGANQTVNEDAGAQTVNWATAISAGPSCESAQTLAFNVSNNNNALFSIQPAISATGVLTYTPAANANGTATVTVSLQDNGGTANGGSDTSASVNFTISVNAVNDAPSFTKGADVTVLEDAAAFTQAAWATAISAGPSDESGQTLSFNVSNNNNALFSVQPAVAANGTLSFTPATNASGTATVSVSLQDNGGTVNGGVDTSPVQTFTITVTAVNDAPSFTVGPNQSVLEDAGPQTVNTWATALSAGPNEASQTLSFEITGNTNSALFASGPAVSATGALTYTPANNANGVATITLRIRDNGGTANGGVDASATQSFTITVTAVNDAPSFTSGGNVTVLRNSGAYGPTNWATAISAGPADETGQTIAFNVTGNTNPSLFSTAPTINGSGQLAFTPANNQFGTAQISVQAQDNGGTANGGQNTSGTVLFTITVQSPPTITSAATAVFPLNVNTTFTITTDGLPNVNSITLTASPGPGACVLPNGVTFTYGGGTTATLSGAATSSTPVNCLVTASNGIAPVATQVLAIIPGTAPALQDDGFVLLNGTASPAGPAPTPWSVFADNGNGVDDRGLPQGNVVSFGGGSLAGTAATNAAGATVSTTTGNVSVNLLANGDLFVNAAGATSGSYSFDYIVQNATGSDTATVTIVVGTAPTISGTPPANATIGSAYGPFTFTLGGSPLPTVSLLPGCTLPAGITLSSAGTLSGTPLPTAASASNCIAVATNAFGVANSNPFAIAVLTPPPTVTTSGGVSTFTEDAAPVVVDGAVTVTAPGSTNLTGATVTIGAGFQSGADVLSCVGSGGVTCSFAGNVLTLSGTDTIATYQTVLRTVRFNNTSQDPSAAARTLSFIASNASGSSVAATKTVNVVIINDPPSFTKGADQTVLEDSGAQTVPGWATAINAGEAGQSVSFNVTGNTNPGLFSTGPAVNSAGVLTFTPAANANGSATITLVAQDNGGTANGGADTSPAQTFVINVTPVNDAPSFTVGASQTVLEDSGPQSVAGWATAISAGPADESAQTLTFNITGNSNPSLFSVAPAVSASGTLTYTPAANAFGSATITLTLQDSGGTLNGGVNTSAPQNFTITVTGVNDAPSFTAGANQTSSEDAGPQSVTSWATPISAGPNESGQTLTFNIIGNTNPGLFSAGPAISATGNLTYTAAPNQNGVATITVTLSDNGGTLNGGVDTSASQSFTITVNAVNDPPVAPAKNGGAVQANMTRTGINANLLAGVTDVDNGINGCVSTTFTVANIGATVTGGTVANVNVGAGTFDFVPAPGFTGTATVSYTVSDTGCPGPAATSAPATISLDVQGPVIWFVNPAAATNGSGTLASPFNSLASATAAMASNTSHRIFVYSGTTAAGAGVSLTGAASQATAQWLIGQGATAADFDTLMSITPPAGTIARPTISGSRPTIQGTVTLNGNNVKAQGFNLSTGANSGMNDGVGAITGVSVSEVSVTTTTGTTALLSDLGGTLSFTSLNANGGTVGLSLTNTTGSFTVTGSSTGNCGGLVVDKNTPATAPVIADCTGGTIQNAAIGIRLDNVQNVSFTRMRITGTVAHNFGIYGTRVNGFTLNKSLVDGSIGTSVGSADAPIAFGRLEVIPGDGANGLLGSNFITDSTISGGIEHNIELYGQTNAYSLTVTRTVVRSNSAAGGSDGIQMETQGSSNATVLVDNSQFDDNRSQAIQVSALRQSTVHFTLRNSRWSNTTQGNEGVLLSNGNDGRLFVDVDGNVVVGTAAAGFAGTTIYAGHVPGTATTSSRLDVRIRNNTITTPSAALNHAMIVFLSSLTGASTTGAGAPANIHIENNTITNHSLSNAIRVDTPDANTNPNFHGTILTNTVTNTNPSGTQAIVAQVREFARGCLHVANNAATTAGAGFFAVRVRQNLATAAASLFEVPPIIGGNTAAAELAANHGSTTNEVLGTVSLTPTACTLPTAPILP